MSGPGLSVIRRMVEEVEAKKAKRTKKTKVLLFLLFLPFLFPLTFIIESLIFQSCPDIKMATIYHFFLPLSAFPVAGFT
jgi:hypothetical protein